MRWWSSTSSAPSPSCSAPSAVARPARADRPPGPPARSGGAGLAAQQRLGLYAAGDVVRGLGQVGVAAGQAAIAATAINNSLERLRAERLA